MRVLKTEIEQLPNIKVIICMGDFAIKTVNYFYKQKYKKQPIKSGSTYKIRKEKQILNIRFYPSYSQTGDIFNIEKNKHRMIEEDFNKALTYLKGK